MLKTEQRNPNTTNIHRMSALEMARVIQEENKNAVNAIDAELDAIAASIDAISERMKKGGRLFYIGCGTSGRLGVLDAAECPPTYGVSSDVVVGIIAGGDGALRNASENAEDSAEAGRRDLSAYAINENDSVIGISAAGGAGYVISAVQYAKEQGALTIALTCNAGSPLEELTDIAIHPDTGAEVITGSTRMKAGSAHKMILNMISTAVMVKQGYVYENMMINLRPTNVKLRDRMIRIVGEITGLPYERSEALLEQNGFVISNAVEAYQKKQSIKKRTMMNNITSSVITREGKQALTVNGQEIDSVAYITYLPDNNRYADFAKAGYNLFSTCVFFGSNSLNSTSGLEVFSKGLFDGELPDFTSFDKDIHNILSVCPNAMIFPRVNVGLSREWEAAHPDELNDQGADTLPDTRRACFSSDIWAAEIERLLEVFIEHIDHSDFRDNIIGYQIAGGNTEEWFSYDQKGSIGKRSREKFAEQVKNGRENSEYEYYRYLSEITAARICQFAARVKELTQRRLVVGTFYGYTLEKPNRYFCHNDLKQVLECPDIDFICSPVSYANLRSAGRNHSYMLALHSLKLHGKLYFSENDTRTHLSRAYSDLPRYQTPIWFGPDQETTLEILKMHFARALVHGHASWWFDMWGGWFADKKYMEFMKKAREISNDARALPTHSRAEVALLFDEKSVAYFADTDQTTKKVLYDIREALGKTGVPYDLYLTSDYDTVRNNYKAFVLLEPCPTEDSERIKKDSISLFTVTPQNQDVTPEDLRKFYRTSGVWLYSDEDIVVYAGQSHLFLHTVHDGTQNIHLPDDAKYIDLFTGTPFEPIFESAAKKSYLLQKVE